MDKMRMESPDITAQNIDRIAALFPSCVTESVDENGKPKKAINFELLKQMLSPDVVEGDERYEFTWVGKKAAIVEANKPIRKTLRPCKEESKNWDITENLYIEGDNLEVLKLLQESYLGKVKMIYIDPPYNTGNDFIYADDFMRSQEEEDQQMGMYDEDGARLFKNTDTNGRFHSDWCSMIYSRLMLARNLLSEDGVIFISIDDNEYETLSMICNEIFGESCFITDIAWRSSDSSNNDAKQFSADFNHTLVYGRSASWQPYKLPRTEKNNQHYTNPDNDPNGAWFSGNVSSPNPRINLMFDIIAPNGEHILPPKNGWRWSKERIDEMIARKEIIFSNDNRRIIKKTYLKDQGGIVPSNFWWDLEETGHNRNAKYELKGLFPELSTSAQFSTPKPTKFIDKILRLSCDKNSIVLDFFSGSATTAHAVMQLNAEDNGYRKFIMVQLPEKCDEKSEAYKAGYKNICEIGKERIRRAGEKIKSESPLTTGNLDVGFRVLKLDDTNMKDVYYAPDDYSQGLLAGLESNIKDDRTDLDLLFGCLLDWGLPLSMPYSSEQIDGCTVHTYNDGDLIACFDENVPESVVEKIAKRQPLRVVFRDSGFANSPAKINVTEIFKLFAPDTRVKVI